MDDVTLSKQGIGIKGREMALVWHEKASRVMVQLVIGVASSFHFN